MTSFLQFAELCQKVQEVSGNLDKVDLVSSFLEDLDDRELGIAASFLMSTLIPEQELGVGPSILYGSIAKAAGLNPATITDLLRKTGDVGLVAQHAISERRPLTLASFAESEPLAISEVYERFQAIAKAVGRGSQDAKAKNLQFLFSEATPLEAQYIARLAMEDLRIGVGVGSVRDAISKAFHQPVDLVERGYNLTNDIGLVAQSARHEGLSKLNIAIGRPIKMMLAQVAESIPAALQEASMAVEWKFDGARVQIHKDGSRIRIFSRRLEDVTSSLPEIAAVAEGKVGALQAILDGEVVAVGAGGRPLPFQAILRRFRRKYHVASVAAKIPLSLNLFDIIYLDGESLIDRPLVERRHFLEAVSSSDILARQEITDDPLVAEQIYEAALKAGHEGIVLKNPASVYSPGKRGKNWLKVKPVAESLDLVVVGARWGEGRRAKLLGSYRLACPDPASGELVDVGWVATGLNDDKLSELSDLFNDLIVMSQGMEVEIKPQVVIEVGYEEIQKSPNYRSGYALRFPRFIGVRDDKSPEEADDLDRIEHIYGMQRGRQIS
ncbi:MAG: ATP-dependent DNA ligase [Methanotrichaceae archaeon]|nr:ATP-dependent DNA ligase [Methanotrichaceae archaeon]